MSDSNSTWLHLFAIIISLPRKHVSAVRFNHLNGMTARQRDNVEIFGGASRRHDVKNGDGRRFGYFSATS
jgi:hypothetical protein